MRREPEIVSGAALLRSAGWLSRTPEAFQSAVLQRCAWHRLDAAMPLADSRRRGGLFGIARGVVHIVSRSQQAEPPILQVARAPVWAAGFSAVPDFGPAFSITARTDCLVAHLSWDKLGPMLDARPEDWRQLAMLAVDGVELATRAASDLLIADTRRRCVAVLLRAAGCHAEAAVEGVAEIRQDQLAAMANMSRHTAGNILRTLAARGWIALGYGTIVIRDARVLRAIIATGWAAAAAGSPALR